MRRLLSFTLAFCLVLVFSPLCVGAEKMVQGQYTYIVEDGEATVVSVSTAARGRLTVPETLGGCPVTAIGREAFYGCTLVTGVSLPDTVRTIDEYAFAFCLKMTRISFSPDIEFIGEGAFYHCERLAGTVNIGEKSCVGKYAFEYCYALSDVKVDENNQYYHKIGGTLKEHSFADACDGVCDECGYVRSAPHECSGGVCVICGKRIAKALLSSANGAIGDTIALTLTLSDAPLVDTMAFEITVPDGFTVLDDTHWTVKGDISSIDNARKLRGVWGSREKLDANGTVLSLSLKIEDGAASGKNEIGLKFYIDSSDDMEDNVLETAGAVKVCKHSYNGWTHDNKEHWHECVYCKKIADIGAHDLNGNTCTDCGAELTFITVEDAVVSHGDTVTLAVTLENAPKTDTMAFELTIPEGITLIEGTRWCFDASASDIEPDTLRGVWSSLEEADVNGEVLMLELKVGDNAALGENEIGIRFYVDDTEKREENVIEYSGTLTVCDHEYGEWLSDDGFHWKQCPICESVDHRAEHIEENGACTVCGKKLYIKGDVDDDRSVSANDAIYLLYNVFFGDEGYPLNQPANFDGEGGVDANDAIYLLYHVFFGEESYPLH